MKLEVNRLIDLVNQDIPLMVDCGKIKIEPLIIQASTHYFRLRDFTELAHIVAADTDVNVHDKLTIVTAYVQERTVGGRTNQRAYAEPSDYANDPVVKETIKGYITLTPLERALRQGDPTHIDLVLVVALHGTVVGSIVIECEQSLVSDDEWMRAELGITADFYVDHKTAYIGYTNGKPYYNKVVFTLTEEQQLLDLHSFFSDINTEPKYAFCNGYIVLAITDPFPRLTVEHFEKLASLGARFPKANSQPLRTV